MEIMCNRRDSMPKEKLNYIELLKRIKTKLSLHSISELITKEKICPTEMSDERRKRSLNCLPSRSKLLQRRTVIVGNASILKNKNTANLKLKDRVSRLKIDKGDEKSVPKSKTRVNTVITDGSEKSRSYGTLLKLENMLEGQANDKQLVKGNIKQSNFNVQGKPASRSIEREKQNWQTCWRQQRDQIQSIDKYLLKKAAIRHKPNFINLKLNLGPTNECSNRLDKYSILRKKERYSSEQGPLYQRDLLANDQLIGWSDEKEQQNIFENLMFEQDDKV